MKSLWLIALIGSVSLLLYFLLKSKISFRWVGHALIHILLAGAALYMINLTGLLGDFHLGINAVTVLIVALLGIPGFAMLIAVKLFVAI